ncbi:reverse transcriptase family protein [Roseobacter litoralis]|uniref:reverse transcriptase family protein n=1 Tax=Roseobacter litoralis TaxID=42443 RepID=UPI0002E991B7|nr:reverse transcriptase family protein [Roseobacter litoralis]
MRKRRVRKAYERYEIDRSPLAQRPSQRDIASLISENKSDLNRLATPQFKEQFLVRRSIESGGKTRDLVYPEGRLRAAHERLKFHLNKIVQPSYLMSPRKNRSQRDNAAAHLDAAQYLTLDIKQFYPSTTRGMIRNSLVDLFGMEADVAGLIAHVATADDRACFGSPLTPVLASLVHRPMFDAIADLCASYDLGHTVWVDDLTISGNQIPGRFVSQVRAIVASHGLRSHKLKYRTGNKAVFITGIGVVGSNLVVPRSVERRSKDLWRDFQKADTVDEIDTAGSRLLSHLGGIRHVVGKSSKRGQKISSEMNSVRQKRTKALRIGSEKSASTSNLRYLTAEEQEERRDEIDAIPF